MAGTGRVVLSGVLNGKREIKDPRLRALLIKAVQKIISEPGSKAYRELWEWVKDLFDGPQIRFPDVWFVILTAYHDWANIALDPAEKPATRLLYGRMAEYVLYQFVHVMKLKGYLDREDGLRLPSLEDAADRGQRVVDALAEILSAHPPDGLFEEGTAEARGRGYRVMRIRLLSDQVGWRGGRFLDQDQDKERTRILSAAFSMGMADEHMWLHKQTGGVEIGDLYHAFVLTLHAGKWRRASEYGCTLISAHPAILTFGVKNLTALCDDRTVRPGIAAMLADEIIDMPPEIRTRLHEAVANHPTAKSAVEKMIPGVRAKKTYLEVLMLGETK